MLFRFVLTDSDDRLSWTVITWIIIYGSTLVMMLWIAIYSAFIGSFTDEVVILFGSVQFWTTIVLSVVISVGK